MRFSIITVVYNDLDNLKKTCRSVSRQTFDDYEHLIIDGGSDDGTLDFLKSFSASDSHVRFISEKDNGIYDAMNKAIAMAEGDYILFLNAGDRFHERDTLSKIADKCSMLNAEC